MAVRVMGQENIAVTFSAKQRSCRFNVGTKLKVGILLLHNLLDYNCVNLLFLFGKNFNEGSHCSGNLNPGFILVVLTKHIKR